MLAGKRLNNPTTSDALMWYLLQKYLMSEFLLYTSIEEVHVSMVIGWSGRLIVPFIFIPRGNKFWCKQQKWKWWAWFHINKYNKHIGYWKNYIECHFCLLKPSLCRAPLLDSMTSLLFFHIRSNRRKMTPKKLYWKWLGGHYPQEETFYIGPTINHL